MNRRTSASSHPRVTPQPSWTEITGIDDRHEIELAPDVFLGIHRVQGEEKWQAMLYDTGNEEAPFLLFGLRSKNVAPAKREALRRATKSLARLLDAMKRAKAA